MEPNDTLDVPTNVEVERIARRTVNLGFAGGQEKTVEYDNRVDTADGETQYRKYLENERDSRPPDKRLSDLARRRNTFTVADRESVTYRELGEVEELYLVSWDGGKTVRIMQPEEVENILDVAAAHIPPEEEREIPEAAQRLIDADNHDTDIPDDDTPEPQEETNGGTEVPNEPGEEQEYDTDIPEPVASEQ